DEPLSVDDSPPRFFDHRVDPLLDAVCRLSLPGASDGGLPEPGEMVYLRWGERQHRELKQVAYLQRHGVVERFGDPAVHAAGEVAHVSAATRRGSTLWRSCRTRCC